MLLFVFELILPIKRIQSYLKRKFKMMNSKRSIDIINLSSCHRIFYTFFNAFNCCAMLVIILIECSLLQPVVSGINHNEFLAQLKVPQCRQDCLDKVSLIYIPDHLYLIWFFSSFTILLFITLLLYELNKLQNCKTRSYLSKQWTITLK